MARHVKTFFLIALITGIAGCLLMCDTSPKEKAPYEYEKDEARLVLMGLVKKMNFCEKKDLILKNKSVGLPVLSP